MSTFAIEVWNDECAKCTFYTIRKDGDTQSEADKFFSNYYTDPYKEDVQKLAQLITIQIGNKYGAIDEFFNRHKRNAQAFPPKASKKLYNLDSRLLDHDLRLYCLRISREIVIIYNGGLKDSRTDQESSDISLKFYEADHFSKKIIQAITEGEIQLNGNTIGPLNDKGELVIL